MALCNELINWYLKNKRHLPWRETKNPYTVWLSEIILQQTRIAQGKDYFLKFRESFPTVYDLANANESNVLKLWQGLGYYSRARNLHFTAKHIVENYDGKFPTTYEELITLKGVGDYTASAIASICFNQPEAVLDGNVYRLLARYYGIETPINTTAGYKEFKNLAQSLICKEHPGDYNQAIMDFGSLQCKPQTPNCKGCILQSTCVAYKTNMVTELPKKEKKLKVKKKYFNFIVVVTSDGKTILEERTGKGIWKGLYQFPLIETQKSITSKEIIEHQDFIKTYPAGSKISLFNKDEIVHKLSHQHLYTKFWIVKVHKKLSKTIDWEEVEKYPVPALIEKFLKDFDYIEH